MSGFWVIAVTFTGGAIALLILPLILHRRDPGTGPSYATIGILAIALPAAAITLCWSEALMHQLCRVNAGLRVDASVTQSTTAAAEEEAE